MTLAALQSPCTGQHWTRSNPAIRSLLLCAGVGGVGSVDRSRRSILPFHFCPSFSIWLPTDGVHCTHNKSRTISIEVNVLQVIQTSFQLITSYGARKNNNVKEPLFPFSACFFSALLRLFSFANDAQRRDVNCNQRRRQSQSKGGGFCTQHN